MRIGRLIANTIVAVVMVLIGLMGMVFLSGLRQASPPRPQPAYEPRVAFQTMVPEPVAFTLSGPGAVHPRARLPVIAEVGGRISAAAPALRPGQRIAAGDPLLIIDAPDAVAADLRAQASLAELKAELARQRTQHTIDQDLLVIEQANLAVSERILANDTALFERGSTSRRALDQQISATNQNRLVVANRRIAVETWPSREAALLARLQAAEAEVARAAETVAKTTVTAPWDAVVLDAEVEAGRAVLPGSQIALIATVHEAEARLPILLEDAMRVLGEETLSRRAPAEGSEPSGAFSADLGSMDRPFPGTLIRLEGRVDPATRQLTAVLQLNDTGSSQLATYDGLFGSITITGRQESGYIVPRRAVHDGGKVWLIDGDNTLRSRQPALEALDGDHWFSPLDGGLKDGDRLVLTEPDRFTDGLPTVPVDMAAKAEDENEAASP